MFANQVEYGTCTTDIKTGGIDIIFLRLSHNFSAVEAVVFPSASSWIFQFSVA